MKEGDTIVFDPTIRKALIITMSKYIKVFEPLSSPPTDGEEIKKFLSSSCNFNETDISWLQEETLNTNINNEFTNLDSTAKNIGKGKLLVFVYYSGHGTIDHEGNTQAHLLDGTPFELETRVRKLSTRPNVAVIAILDCCRLEHKGFVKVVERVPGQLGLIHATEAGKIALGGIEGQCSVVTKEFLEVMQQTSLTFPLCIQNWAKSHKKVQFSDKMQFEVPLKFGTALTSKIPDKVSSWTSEHLISWLESIKVRRIEKYTKEIANPDFGYDGLWLWNRKDQPKELEEFFSMKADLGDVKLELKRWIDNHPQY